MKAYQLTDRSVSSAPLPDLAQLIDFVGDDAFAPALFQSAFGLTKPDHLTAFSFSGDREPRVVVAENTGRLPVARNIASQYRRDYWQHDLANQVTLSPEGRKPDGSWGVRTSASEIEYANYRAHCYTSVGLEDRISIFEARGGDTVRVNFYRYRGNAFSDEDTARIFDSAKLLLALVRRHDKEVSASTTHSPEQCRTRLAAIAPSLPPRELDVCASIVNGVTSEGIALALNVSINTVFTYRKRAYARLGISSQNELVKLVLNGASLTRCRHN